MSPRPPQGAGAPQEVPAGAEWLPPLQSARAVEFYKEEIWAPIQYQRPAVYFDRGKTCGVLLVWTKATYGDVTTAQ